MLKISIVLPNLKFGGAERLHLNLARDWVERGFNVEFILMKNEGDFIPLVPKEVKIVNLGVSRLRSIVFPLAAYFRKSKPDYILAAMWPLTSYATMSWILSGKIGKIFLSEHVLLTISASKEIKVPLLYLKIFIKLTHSFASGVIAVSKGVRDDLLKISNLGNKIKVIYNPAAIGIPYYRESKSVRIKLWGAKQQYNVLSVAELKEEKDHETLIKSFYLLPKDLNVKLIILGDGGCRKDLQSLIKTLKLLDKVELPGFVRDPYPWYRSADLFVLSSKWEGFGNVIVEALECGVPVVSTDCPTGPREILDHGRYGDLVPVGDPVEMSNAILANLISKKNNSEELIKRSNYFSLPRISNKYLDYFFQE